MSIFQWRKEGGWFMNVDPSYNKLRHRNFPSELSTPFRALNAADQVLAFLLLRVCNMRVRSRVVM